MKFVFFISNLAMPMIILIIVIYGIKERKDVFDLFLEGAKEGIKITLNILPLVKSFMINRIFHDQIKFFTVDMI